MSSGCIPKKADRDAVVERAIDYLEKALLILRAHKDPDKAARKIEEASGFVSRALGDFYDDGASYHDPEEPKRQGLRRLLEHYFS